MKTSGWQIDSQSPILRYGILIIAIIFWYFFLFDPMAKKIDEMDSRISAVHRKIVKAKTEIKLLHGINEQLRRVEQDKTQLMQRLIPGENPQVVASNLQDDLLKKGADAGMEILSYRTSADGKWHDYQLGTASLVTKTGMKGLTRFMLALDAEDRIIRINNLSIMVIQGPNPYSRISMDVDAICLADSKNDIKNGVKK
ncbi:MAG: hypothetical protein ACUVQ6_01360 [Dissulfurimicrobium sp.]|uniref:hypothetical protein n=1 Tax=Dissulfurimicrobium sp. TaxID=2022436 RepID=UPI00404AF176